MACTSARDGAPLADWGRGRSRVDALMGLPVMSEMDCNGFSWSITGCFCCCSERSEDGIAASRLPADREASCCCWDLLSLEMSKCRGLMAGRAEDGLPFIMKMLLAVVLLRATTDSRSLASFGACAQKWHLSFNSCASAAANCHHRHQQEAGRERRQLQTFKSRFFPRREKNRKQKKRCSREEFS